MIRTTVVIPNLNGIAYLKNCLDSLMKQTVCADIIVVDNGSTDGSAELLTDYCQGKEHITYISLTENTGFTGGVNTGIRAAATEYILLLNNDIYVEPDFVEQLELAMDAHPKAFSANAQMRMMHQPDRIDSAGIYYCALGWAFDYGKGKKVSARYEQERRLFACCGGASIYRKSVLEQIGIFDDNHFAYLEDVDIGFRARIHGYENWYAPKAIAFHAGSATSGSKYNEFKTNLSSRNSIYLIKKNMPILMRIINIPFFVIGFGVKTLFFARKKMGRLYLKGLKKGFALSYSESGKHMRVSFRWSHILHYIGIQLELWINIFRRIC